MKIILKIIMLLILASCAHKANLSDSELKDYASYQMNCPADQLKLEKLSNSKLKFLGCKQSEVFTKVCPLGACYIIK